MTTKTINIARDYTRYPAGRFRSDGPYSGQQFREQLLVPALGSAEVVSVELDGVAGYGSSFLEEAFGGLVRTRVISSAEAGRRIQLVTTDPSLVSEIQSYMVQ